MGSKMLQKAMGGETEEKVREESGFKNQSQNPTYQNNAILSESCSSSMSSSDPDTSSSDDDSFKPVRPLINSSLCFI